jgi:hypothetical protein
MISTAAWQPLIEHFEIKIGKIFSLKQIFGSEAFQVQVVNKIRTPINNATFTTPYLDIIFCVTEKPHF